MTSVYFKKFSFLISLTFLAFSAESFAKTTHCLVVRGKGVFHDPKITESSYILASEPLNGNCKYFDTWDDLYLDFSKNKEKFTENDQFFIDQAVHGMPGGRAFDCPGPKADGKEAKTPEDVGGTSPSKIIGILEDIAGQHQVLFLNQSCHGGSLLTRYLQHLDSSGTTNETQSRLCIMTDSAQGMVSHGATWVAHPNPTTNLAGLSATDIYRMKDSFISDDPPVSGLISAASMAVLDEHKRHISHWEGQQFPMVIRYGEKHELFTGAYQHPKTYLATSCPEKEAQIPVWGIDTRFEQIYRPLQIAASEEEQGEKHAAHRASVKSLDSPPLSERQALRRKACDSFIF